MVALSLLVGVCAAQAPTELSVALTPGADVDYSDAVMVDVSLLSGGVGVVDARIDLFLRSDAHGIVYSPGSLMATGADGAAGPMRVRFVDGAYGVPHLVAADPDGEPYILEARYLGDDTHAADQTTSELRLHRESIAMQLLPEYASALGDAMEIVATLVDTNGDAEEGDSGTTGRTPKAIADASLAFYIDLNGDGDFVDPDEGLGSATTAANGVAALAFDTTPVGGLPRAGLHADAVRVEFSGDDRYKVAVGLSDLRLDPAALAPEATLFSVDPPEAPADGYTRVLLEAILVDVFGSPLGPDDPPHEVVFESSAGQLLAAPERDPGTGRYRQELRAPRSPAAASVVVHVDGSVGPAVEVVYYDPGCGCRGGGGKTWWVTLGALVGLGGHRRRWR